MFVVLWKSQKGSFMTGFLNKTVLFFRGTFQIYKAGESGPVLFLVHGGGYTGLSWSLLAAKLKQE